MPDHTTTPTPPIGSPLAWDLFCIGSLIGIWPRYIEPRLIFTTQLELHLPQLPPSLDEFKILQISDLHITDADERAFDQQLFSKINRLNPDLIALTGDFLCYGRIHHKERLQHFLKELKAPFGCYAVLGNHDYASCVSLNDNGEYDLMPPTQRSTLSRAFGRMLTTTRIAGRTTSAARSIPLNAELLHCFEQSSVKLLHNDTHTLDIKSARLNVCGLGEYTLGRIDPVTAFKNYDQTAPGIILMHNPDGIKLLKGMPGDVVLSGHTHGGQVNLPWIWKNFIQMEDTRLKRGLVRTMDKWIYINRGLGSIFPFRWFAPPEILLLTLRSHP